MSKPYILYGWEVSPFTAKVEAYLKYKGIHYKKCIPHAYTLQVTIPKKVGKTIMPVVKTPEGKFLQDSSFIIDYFEKHYPDNSIKIDDPRMRFVDYLLEIHADEWLCMSSLHYRWHYPENKPFIYKEFGKAAAPFFPGFVQKKLVEPFVQRLSGYPPLLGVSREMQPQIEAYTEGLLTLLNDHFEDSPYLLGNTPGLGDFALFGQLYAHLHRDPYPARLVAKYNNVLDWLEALKEGQVRSQTYVLNPDELPDALMATLSLIETLQLPLIEASVQAVNDWAEVHGTGDKIPQAIGKTTLSIGDVTAERACQTYSYWMLQRLQQACLTERESLPVLSKFLNTFPGFIQLLKPLSCQVNLKRSRLYLGEPIS